MLAVWLTLLPATARAQLRVRLDTAGLTVITDAGEASARPLFDRILEMKQAFPIEFDADLTVLILTRDQRFERLRNTKETVGFFQRSGGESYIVLSDPKLVKALRHEFVHFALDHAAVVLPHWLDEGLAEYYSTLEAERDHLLAGAVIPAHLEWLRTHGVGDLRNIRDVYPVGWALVHMLKHDRVYRPHFGLFWQRLQLGETAGAMLPEAFGRRDWRQVTKDLETYVRRPEFATERIAPRGPMVAMARVDAQALTAEEFDQHYLRLVRAMGRMEALEFTVAGQASPLTKAIATAMKATAERRQEAARPAWERALALGARRAEVYFEYAGALRDTGAPESEVVEALQRVVELNPRFTPANLWLASLEGQQGRWGVAEKYLLFAAAESPRRFEVWYELAFARRQQGSGKLASARDAAAKAVAVALTKLDREKAEALRDSSLAALAAPPAADVAVPAAKGWEMPVGDRQLEAEWVELTCEQPAVVRISTGEEFLIRDPAKVTLKNTGALTFEFKCGKQEPARRIRLGVESATREVRLMELLP